MSSERQCVAAEITSSLYSGKDQDHHAAAADLVLAVAWLQRCDSLETVPQWLVARTHVAVRQLQPQHDPKLGDHAAAQWLLLVSLADSLGLFDLARALINQVERLLNLQKDDDSGVVLNFMAIALARRARIARQGGDAESAVEWYRAGLRLLKGLPKADAWATCTLGLATCAQSVGNFPLTMKYCRAVLRAEDMTHHALFGAHLTLAVCHRRLDELQFAVQHAWKAYYLAPAGDEGRSQCLVNLSEIALRLGYVEAARNGFRVLLASPQPERNRIPAHVGLLAAEVLMWKRSPDRSVSDIQSRIEVVESEAEQCRQPYERIKALLAALDASLSIAWIDRASSIEARVHRVLLSAVSTGTRFHEYWFRYESAKSTLGHLARSAASQAVVLPQDFSPEILSKKTKRAMAQLAALSLAGSGGDAI